MPGKGDYQVGYGKPPQHTRFRKGQSGNRRGRPPGSKNLATIVSEALNEKVVVIDNGRRRTITKREATVAQLINKSAQADLKAIQMVLGLVQDIERRADGPNTTGSLSEADRQVLEFIRAHLGEGEMGAADAGR